MNVLLDYDWPGNVRELKNVIQFSVVRCRGKRILPADLPPEISGGASPLTPVHRFSPDTEPFAAKGKLDAASVKAALTKTGGNKSKAARALGVGRATLYRFLSNNADAMEFSRRL
jgi:transcriptional regulator of acetoin/glycerol metabolism